MVQKLTFIFLQAEKDQRLIYSGKLLQDNLLMRDVFSKVRDFAIYEVLSVFISWLTIDFNNRPVYIVCHDTYTCLLSTVFYLYLLLTMKLETYLNPSY